MKILLSLCATAVIGGCAPTPAHHTTVARALADPSPIPHAVGAITVVIGASVTTVAAAAVPIVDDDGCPLPGNVQTKSACTMRPQVATP